MLFYKMLFVAFIELILRFLPFILSVWCITFIDLCMLSHLCIPGKNPTWLWCMIASICWRIFAFSHQGYWPIVFLPCIFFWLWYRSNIVLVQWVWECPLLFSFLEEFKKVWYYLAFKCLVDFTAEIIWSWASLEDFDYLLLVCSYFLFFSCFSLGRSSVSRNLSF